MPTVSAKTGGRVIAYDYHRKPIPKDTRARYDFRVTIPVSWTTDLGYEDALDAITEQVHAVKSRDWDIEYAGGEVLD